MLDFLLAVQHLPAFYAEDLSVGLCLDEVEALNEVFPFWRITLDHFGLWYLSGELCLLYIIGCATL